MRHYLWVLTKKYRDFFILFVLAIIFFVVYLFLYLRPSVLELSPLNILSCGNNYIFGSMAERGTVSTIAEVEIKCGGEFPVEIEEKTIPAFLILNQPDETINYFFARQLVFNNKFSFPEELSNLSLNQVHPRSTTVINGNLAPIGFPGFIMVLAGLIKIFTIIFSPSFFNIFAVMITPFFAVITPFLGYYIWQRFWNKKVALVAAILLFILPAWWYNASRPFQHNLFFVFLLMASLSFYLSSLSNLVKQKTIKIFLSGLLWGLAFYIRPAEFIWLAGLGILGLFLARQRWNKKDYVFVFVSFLLVMGLFLATQYAFYGHIFGSGYVKPGDAGQAGIIFQGPQGINFWQALIFPFGLHPIAVVKTFISYFFILFRPWFWLVVSGLAMIFLDSLKIKRHNQQMIAKEHPLDYPGAFNLKYILVWFVISIYILFYYGSWEFYDNLAHTASIGTSYVRYFLPIYVFILPVVAYFLISIWSFPKKSAKFLIILLSFLLLISSAVEVYYKLDGLTQVKETVQKYQVWQDNIYELTEPEAIILTRYADKYIFPGRKVIVGWQEPEQIKAITALVKEGLPFYFYDLQLLPIEKQELTALLNQVGLQWGNNIAVWEDLELTQIVNIKP